MEAERRRDAGAETYGPESIKVLKGLDAVRGRPRMYVGGTANGSGLHNTVYEAADNAISEGLAGYADLVSVALNAGGSVKVEGVAVVNALSTRLELTIWRGGQEHFMAFADGVPEAPLKAVKSAPGKTGTRVTVTPRPAIFSMVEFGYAALERRFRGLAFLNSGVKIVLSDLRGAERVKSAFKI